MRVTLAIFVFDGVQILDVTGPAAVFAAANDCCASPYYDVRIVSANGGCVGSSSAVQVASQPLAGVAPGSIDILLVAGGDEAALQRLAQDWAVARWVTQAGRAASRIGSICTGVFLLAPLGVVAGRRVATHWSACARLADSYPDLEVDADSLYVEDGRVWTSAGVTTGIDMCLAMVERDLGKAVAQRIAERLVLYARRPGYQSQFSPVLQAQARAGTPFAALVEWMGAHLHEPLDVPQLAAHMAMSERSFYRKFSAEMGQTPARFVEVLRLDRVRQLLVTGKSLKEIAAQTGFSGTAPLSKAFERRYGVTPRLFRQTRA
ncbi:MAG TPA: GlxA family transcriptional regulator [Noviherbaspirillum sp.]|uniref:GlxA family transcriptional regulator n=1 Tax=Noviherbaspirillum sp. TaxID=1926288 RepID=UPI002D5EF458|nr:GlxA family transcriptional regulator [Noviherbaspirillum sp.]HYD96953.1 GlxA family transcriptional regulator [Noviherbaspirillum sp.]